jgi:hypothetical protein
MLPEVPQLTLLQRWRAMSRAFAIKLFEVTNALLSLNPTEEDTIT